MPRRLLGLVALTSSSFEALCLDHFPHVHRLFTRGMDRLECENLLLQVVPPHEILRVLWQIAPEVLSAEAVPSLRSMDGSSCSSTTNPYQGLAPFSAEKAHLFFGREELTRKLQEQMERLWTQTPTLRILTLLGPSGSGKSSLARAGLMHNIIKQGGDSPPHTRAILMRPGVRPFQSLARAILSKPESHAPNGIDVMDKTAHALRRRGADGSHDGICRVLDCAVERASQNVVIVVDQFEELYTQCTNEQTRADFICTLLCAAQDPQTLVTFVLVLRSDFLVEVDRYHPDLSQAIAASNAVIPAMTEAELRRAITKPAQLAGVTISAAVLDLLLEQSRKCANSLPLLQFALAQIWDGTRDGRAPEETLREMGGVGGGLAQQARALLSSVPLPQQAQLRRIFLQLVQLGPGLRDACRRVPIEQLIGYRHSVPEVLSLLQRFSNERCRLLTISGQVGSGYGIRHVEITHEALLEHWEELRNWIAEAREDQLFHDRITQAANLWAESRCHAGRLWHSPDLDLLHDYFRRCGDALTRRELDFLASSTRHKNRKRRLRCLRIAFVILGLVCGCFIIGFMLIEQYRLQRTGAEISLAQASSSLRYGAAYESFVPLLRALKLGATDTSIKYLMADAVRSFDALQVVISGPHHQISSASFSPNGRRVVIASGDGTAVVADTSTGAVQLLLKGHEQYVNSAYFRPDGSQIATAGADGTTRLWDAYTGKELQVLRGHSQAVNQVTFSLDSRMIATASADRTARVWSSIDGRQIPPSLQHDSYVNAATFSADGRKLLTGSADSSARLWDVETGKCERILNGHHGPINSVALSPDGKIAATASADKIVHLWALDDLSSALPAPLIGHTSFVNSVVFSPDGEYVLTASTDGTVRLWETNTRQLIQVLEGHATGVNRAEFSRDGKFVVSAGNGHSARIWKLGNAKMKRQRFDSGTAVRTGCLSHREAVVAVAGVDRTVRILDAATGAVIHTLRKHHGSINSLSFDSTDKFLASGSDDGSVLIWNLENGTSLQLPVAGQTGVRSVAFAPEGMQLLTGDKDGRSVLWNIQSAESMQLPKHADWVNSVGFSPDGHLAFTASSDGSVFVLDTVKWQILHVLNGHHGRIRKAAFSHNGMFFITGSEDQTAKLWEVSTWRVLQTFSEHLSTITGVGISRDNERVLTTSKDQKTCIWSAISGQLLSCLGGYSGTVNAAQFDLSGEHVVTFAEDGTVRRWDVRPETRSPAELTKLLRCAAPSASPEALTPSSALKHAWSSCNRLESSAAFQGSNLP